MEQRFIRNLPTISEAEQRLLRTKRAAIIGCGGLGGHIAELLARAGVGGITVADGDRFEESNLNRQSLALPSLMGENKARAAQARIKAIDGSIAVLCFPEFFTESTADAILDGADIVLDGLDSIPSRLLLEAKCAEKGLQLVHGAVEGHCAQICVVTPGSGMLSRLYGQRTDAWGKSVLGPTAALCAALQCAEALKILCGRAASLEDRLLVADLQTMEFNTLPL